MQHWVYAGALALAVWWAYAGQSSCVLIAEARLGRGLSQLRAVKLEAALTLALEVTGRYHVVPVLVRDSVVVVLQQRGDTPTAQAVARQLGCGAVCFALAECFVHLLRVELAFRWAPEFTRESRGVGYALVRYARHDTRDLLYDPALLEATQRALAVALGDSGLYLGQEPPLRIVPAALMAVGSIAYEEAPELPPWQLFARKVVTSYEAVLEAIDTARHHPCYVVCDIDTRDSIYARAGFFEPENYNPPTPQELALLAQMEVQYFLAGWLRRVPEGARLRLELYRLRWSGGTVVPELVDAREASIAEDSSQVLRRTVRQLTGQLLWQSP